MKKWYILFGVITGISAVLAYLIRKLREGLDEVIEDDTEDQDSWSDSSNPRGPYTTDIDGNVRN